MCALPLRWLLAFFILGCAFLRAPATSAAPLRPATPVPPPAFGGIRLPILMYHYIRSDPNRYDPIGEDLSVPPARFAEQMAFLAAHGFHTVTLDALRAALLDGAALPPHPVILTFDDGYADFYTAAYPILRRYGFQAISFVITGKVGQPGYLTWAEMQEMQAGGLVRFESHTVDHVELGHVPPLRAEYELLASKTALEVHLGQPVDDFCYPSGDYTPAVENLVAQAGYEVAVTTRPGPLHYAHDLLALTRVRIHGSDSLAAFAAHVGLAAPPALIRVPSVGARQGR